MKKDKVEAKYPDKLYPTQAHRSSGKGPGAKLGGPSPAPKGYSHQNGKTSKS